MSDAFTPFESLAGGALIGLAASLLLLAHGRVTGISGIVGGLLEPRPGEVGWRLWFVAGLIGAGLVVAPLVPTAFAFTVDRTLAAMAVAGLLVGFGTRLGNGCTSGHGVCGLSRLSPRSLVATVTFMVTGGITVFVVEHALGGAP